MKSANSSSCAEKNKQEFHPDAMIQSPPKKSSKGNSSPSGELLEKPRSGAESTPDDVSDTLPPQYMQSVEHVLEDIGEVKALETSVAHFTLGYVGTFDCLAEYKGTLCLIDWKTSQKLKSSLADCYDYPLQAAAYAGAINQDTKINLKVL